MLHRWRAVMKNRIATLLLGIASFAGVSILADTARAAQYEVLYSFAGSVQMDGSDPDGSLIVDSAGSLYGVTLLGGTANVGAVFELIRQPGGYQERVLYSFTNGS